MQKSLSNKSRYIIISLIIVLVAFVISNFIQQGANQIVGMAILISSLILWISNVIPMSLSIIIMIGVMLVFKIISFEQALSNISITTAIFVMASSGMALAILHSSIPSVVTNNILRRVNDYPSIAIFAVGMVVTFFSAFMSSLAICALFSGIILAVLKENNIKPKESRFGKAIMLIIPACAGIGGFMSPAGTPANILIMDILNKNDINITFLQWCIVGFPIGILTSILFLLSAILVIKPEKIAISNVNITVTKLKRREKYIIGIVVFIVINWFISGIYSWFSITTISVIGLLIMFIFRFVKISDFFKEMNWDMVFTIGLVTTLMFGVNNTGLIATITEVIFNNIKCLSPIFVIIISSFVVCIFRAFIPTTTAVIVLFSPMLIGIAEFMGVSIVPYLFILSFWAASALLIVYTEPIYLISYKEGYFLQKDLFFSGVLPSLIMVVLTSFIIPALVNFAEII